MAGIFDTVATDLFVTYTCRLRFRDRVVGGTPSNPKLIEGWIRAKAGITQDEEIRSMTLRTLKELGADLSEIEGDDVDLDKRFESIEQAAALIAKQSNTTMFKRDASGLYLESRTIKAMLKECVNVLFAGDRWGRRVGQKGQEYGGKGPKNATAEWVFVEPDRIALGTSEPDGIDLSIGHINGPQGPRSTLDYYEYVERATIEFQVMVLRDRVDQDNWPAIWRYAQENGLGAKRSQGFGRFDVLAWDRRNGTT